MTRDDALALYAETWIELWLTAWTAQLGLWSVLTDPRTA